MIQVLPGGPSPGAMEDAKIFAEQLLVSWHKESFMVSLSDHTIFQASQLLSFSQMPVVIVPQGTPNSSTLGQPIAYGYEFTYWQVNSDIYDYLSEAFDVELQLNQAYLVTDAPLKVYPLG